MGNDRNAPRGGEYGTSGLSARLKSELGHGPTEGFDPFVAEQGAGS